MKRTDKQVDLFQDVAVLDETLGWAHNVVLNQLVVKRMDDGWLAMVKGKKEDSFVIAFVGGSTLSAVLENLAVSARSEILRFRIDEYPPGSYKA